MLVPAGGLKGCPLEEGKGVFSATLETKTRSFESQLGIEVKSSQL